MARPIFLDLPQVLRLHRSLIARYGGIAGVRDLAVLQSAVFQPRATFGGEYLHEFPFEMAAAYLFHIVRNHPFVDGNKRTGAASAIVFLHMNGFQVESDESGLVDITLRTAAGAVSKKQIADFFQTRTP